MESFREFVESGGWDVSVMVVRHRGRVLILRRGATAPWKPGMWNLPGGAVDPGESPEDAARRECREECGIDPQGVTPLGSFPDGGGTVHAFAGEATSPRVVLGLTHGVRENDAFRWVGPGDADAYDYALPLIGRLVQMGFDKG